ncbi:uncharacterized protein LOC125468828 [Pyrus x bretschneideri]|uniref:uncharacterized protein LOC125468828 n=1 Tax=Pyrus x bretschneideri TaxID=225117 RepID=UPI00202E0DBB|nr:uncharacterized protein LOC125468828 [Pyrus x bretschneideri]
MTKLANLDFAALDIAEKNYLTWVVHIKIHLKTGNLGETIRDENSATSQDWSKVMIFIRRHIDEGLNSEYLTVENPLAFWKTLYNHPKMMILPRVYYEWTHLMIQDFKSMIEYNFAIFRISFQMKLCREIITKEDMLEKTFSIFHVSNVLLQQQYRK